MNPNESDYLLCYPVLAGYCPPVLSWQDRCTQCARLVWRARSSPPEPQALCLACGMAQLKEDDEIILPTLAQLIEIKKSIG